METTFNKTTNKGMNKWIKKLIPHVHQQELTETAGQQTASPGQGLSLDEYCEQTNQALLMIPELEFHKILGEKEEQTAKLEKEKGALLEEVEQLKQLLQVQKNDANLQNGFFQAELAKQAGIQKEASLKIQMFDMALATERNQCEEMEMVLAQLMEDNFYMETSLSQKNEDLQHKSCLLVEKESENAGLVAALNQAKEDLENERRQWMEEKSSLLESLNEDNMAHEEEKVVETALMDRMSDLERQMDQIDAKEPKRKSLRKRFLQLFRRT
ncbi:pollen-specific leucine-rich repeat extensin-like protein 2 [Scomber scombrus]|uniref:Pollen-specific leucine-rich repeat extensin-like protein 2 n=1 Tax=Scomber scombrus TaxID=13677 RepID=A0AAV1NUY8_SCOSC